MSRLIDKLQAKVLEIAPQLLGDGKDVEVNLPAIDAILDDLGPIFEDGFQWSDIPKAFQAVTLPLMQLAGTHSGKSGEEKKKFVVDSICVIYFHYNPDIPGLPNIFGIEDRVERVLVPMFAEIAVESTYGLYKKIKDKATD